MKKIFLLLAIPYFSGSILFAQTLSDAIKQTTNEQFETADKTFKSLLQTSPSNGDIYFYYGENFFKNDNIEMATKMYLKGVEMNATNPLCYVGLGKVQWYKGKQAEAKANFFKATTLAKTFQYDKTLDVAISIGGGVSSKAKYKINSEATVLMKIAEAYINADFKDITEAQNLLSQAIKLEPFNPEIYITRGDAYLEKNDGSKAIEDYENADKMQISTDPRRVKAILRQGQLYNRSRNYPLALDFYKKSLQIDSSFAPAYREMAEIYFRAGQYNKASEQYKRYLQLNKDCGALARYAGFLNQAKQFAESIEAAKEAVKCDPNNVYLYRYLTFDYYDLTPTPDYVLGLENSNLFFEKADSNVKIIPEDYEYRAKLLSKTGKDSLAIIAYEKLLKMNPEKINIYSDIATSYRKMKNYPKAIDFFKKKLEYKKTDWYDYYSLGNAYYLSKDYLNADTAFSQIIKLDSLAIGFLWRAKSNIQLDLKSEKWLAKPFYEQYLAKIKPEDSEKNKNNLIEAYTYLGVYYMKNNKDFKKAKTYFQKVLDLDPKNQNAIKFMESSEAKKIN